MAEYVLVFHPAALDEAERARDWYQERNPIAARGFLREFDRSIEGILSSPEAWPRHLLGTRAYILAGFPFSVVYRVKSQRVEILAVAHHKRRPGYWARRRSF